MTYKFHKKQIIQRGNGEKDVKTVRFMNGLKEQLDWVKRQIEYANFSSEYKLRLEVKKGEIYEFDWGINVNSEFSNRHYGLVLKDSNEFDPLVLVCPLKTNKYGAHPASDINLGEIKELRSNVETLAVVNQTRSLDKLRIFSRSAIAEDDSVGEAIIKVDDSKLNDVLLAYYTYVFSN